MVYQGTILFCKIFCLHLSASCAPWCSELRVSRLSEPQKLSSCAFLIQVAVIFACIDLGCCLLLHFACRIGIFNTLYSLMEEDIEEYRGEWGFIDESHEWDVVSDISFQPPVSKATAVAKPPSIQLFPRSPAPLQVPSMMQQASSSSGALTSVHSVQSKCKVTVQDVSIHETVQIGIHRSAPYQIADLKPGVCNPPMRTGYQPQSFVAKSQPPHFLQANCVSSEIMADLPPAPVIPSVGDDSQTSTKAPKGGRRGGSKSQLTQMVRLKHPSDSPIITGKFDALLKDFGYLSDVYRALSESQFATEHRNRLLNAFAASTVFRYLQAIQQFSTTLGKLGISITTLSVPQLVDCLAVMSHSKSSSSDCMSGNFTLKALRWFRKIAGVQCLEIVFSPLADSFLKVRLTTDKKEAPPLPLWLLFHWEKRILYAHSSTYEIIMLGSFLFILWSGLRYSDAQRLNVASLVLTDDEIRGMVWRSKTRSNGHPFGLVSSGLCSTGSFTWLLKFLRTWDKLLSDANIATCDFLIPDLSEQGTWLSQEPLDYAGALRIFRTMIYTPWKRFAGKHPLDAMQLNYTLHSLKVTLLSWGPQLGSAVDSDDRLQQGHHADPRKSLHLYGRDSVWGSLRYQKTVIQKIREGFRPKTAQHRGGQTPLSEPLVNIELFRKPAEEFTYQFLPFSQQSQVLEVEDEQLTEEAVVPDSSSSEASSQSEQEVEAQSDAKTMVHSKVDAFSCDEVILAKHRRVTHAMVVSLSHTETTPKYMEHWCRPACGTHMTHQETTFLDEWDMNSSFCQHPGCKKAWSALGMC